MSLVVYYTDVLVYILLIGSLSFLIIKRDSVLVKRMGQKILSHSRYVISSVVLLAFILLGMLDTIHYKPEKDSITVISVLDRLLSPQNIQTETTYSAPFATHSYVPEMIKSETGKIMEIYPRLEFAGQHLNDPSNEKRSDILQRFVKGLLLGLMFSLLLFFLNFFFNFIFNKIKLKKELKISMLNENKIVKANGYQNGNRIANINGYTSTKTSVQVSFWLALSFIICLTIIISNLMFDYHVLGTDKVGRDVFYMSLKSIRTGLIIGSLTTFIILPFALLFGMMAGYFKGWIDDVIQYVYITLSSIPAVLLIAAAVVSFQLKIEANPDLKLLLLCMILGLTSWTSLCRYVRAETLKLRDSEFVLAAITLGTRRAMIIWRHILPNLMHIVVITLVLDFSGLVLAEAVLTYIGVGVDSATYSWGTMINAARLEMGRDPIVWWSLTGALVFMFALVFSANIFSEAIQEALSPRRE